jgi:LytS/YehU family sensor histidine kinase
MLDRLNDYLRSTLTASRATEHPLSAEFDRLRDYLELMQIRMGERLHYTMDLPADLAQHKVPPLVLQSLVENAIVHGLEPKVAGGQIHINARTEQGKLVLEVRDTGVGFDSTNTPEGFGMTQVRERLATRYGNLATMDIVAAPAIFQGSTALNGIQNSPLEGCSVRLRIPLDATNPSTP